jgi:hypothetical protein
MLDPPEVMGDPGEILQASVFRRSGKKRCFQEETKVADSESMQGSLDELESQLGARRKGYASWLAEGHHFKVFPAVSLLHSDQYRYVVM